MIRQMKHGFLVLGFGFAWIAAGCGSVSSTGGTGGSGGPGTGGQSGGGAGTPGTGGAAGAPGTGGAAGAPGTGGHAGAPGTGGHAGGKGGHGGDGGASGGRGGGTAGPSARAAMPARVARPGAVATAVRPATSSRPRSRRRCPWRSPARQAPPTNASRKRLTGPLGGCAGCGQYVNDKTTLNALRAQYEQQGCPHTAVCPAVLCIVPQKEGCKPSDASAGGTCTPVVLTGTN